MEFYKMFNKRKINSVHMIGIGGMGMSSLAFFLKLNNIEVSGSDIGQDPIIKKLKKIGCTIYGLHSSENIKNPDLIIYSSAIKENNPELIIAKKNILPGQKITELNIGLMRSNNNSLGLQPKFYNRILATIRSAIPTVRIGMAGLDL